MAMSNRLRSILKVKQAAPVVAAPVVAAPVVAIIIPDTTVVEIEVPVVEAVVQAEVQAEAVVEALVEATSHDRPRLPVETVKMIRASALSQKKLSNLTGASKNTISSIQNKKSYMEPEFL